MKKAKDKKEIGSQAKRAAIERLLRSLRYVDDCRFDRNPWLLNTTAGIIDLKWTGEPYKLRPFSRDDLITKVTAAAPEGDCPRWLEHIEFVSNGDKDLAAYLQKLAG